MLADPRDFLLRRSDEGAEHHLLSQAVCLPGQLGPGSDVSCFEQEDAQPNFVTAGSVRAPIVVAPDSPSVDVAGRIVLIPNADPGYDWMLAREIAGLITIYGGANSHMAVRAAELRLPAAIGVGEARFNALAAATIVQLDCASRNERRDALDQRWATLFEQLGATTLALPNSLADPAAWITQAHPSLIVLTGGNDIADLVDGPDAAPERDRTEHPITVHPTAAARPLRDGRAVNSFHNWAVPADSVPAGWQLAATAPDGTVEAITHATLPQVALMWHPERGAADADDLELIRQLIGSHR